MIWFTGTARNASVTKRHRSTGWSLTFFPVSLIRRNRVRLPIMKRNMATAQGESFITASLAAMWVREKKTDTAKMARKMMNLLL